VSTRIGPRGAFLSLLYFASFGVILLLFFRGLDFYRTPLIERAHHPGYWEWKAGGAIGHKLALVGSSMMVLMLLYSVRKRVGALRKAGPLGRWLDVHIYMGLAGPSLVVLHSTFKVHGLVALSFWSMVVVVASGILGRYLYLQIPRTRAGEELALVELERQDRELTERLRVAFRLDDAQLAWLEGLVPAAPVRTGLLGGLVRTIVEDFRLTAGLRDFAQSCRSVPRPVFREFERVVRQKALVRRRVLLWDRAHELFHYWHVLHKPFALVMYLFMVVHVVVALMTGYAWGGPW
jgi:hypothetical protein